MIMDPGIPAGMLSNSSRRVPGKNPNSPDNGLEFSEIFSDINLGYITRMIMAENMEDKGYMHQGDYRPDFGAPIARPELPEPPDDWLREFVASSPPLPPADHSSPLCSSGDSSGSSVDELSRPPLLGGGGSPSGLLVEADPVWQCQFRRGVEEASKFLPEISRLEIGLGSAAGVDERREDSGGRKNKKKNNSEDEGLGDPEEGRRSKQSAAFEEGVIRSEMFDEVLLLKDGSCTDTISDLIETLKNEAEQCTRKPESKGSGTGRSRGGKKKQGRNEVADLRTLLIHCSQAVAADDRRSAEELLRQIRKHASAAPGDGTQKLAQIFADGLQARLAGTGTRIYRSLVAKTQSVVDILKAYRLYIAACPFKRISHFFANRTILNLCKNASALHIVDFGINFGFQWPCLIQQLSMLRPTGPPRLRITGIDVPRPGFRPEDWIKETGHRLADYCATFKVPFEYHPIAANWEEIQVEDLRIREDEVLVVNSLYRFRSLPDETVSIDSPRDVVLANIRRMCPDVFIHAVINGSYSAPFFVTRFREALFFYSSLFDMLETTIPRDHPEKLLIQNEIFGKEAINVVACEGMEREERPETYRQWQVRSIRAGFKQLPLDPDILKAARDKVRSSYHKDFLIDADGRWLLQGWKGRVIYGLSTWIPTAKGS